MRPLRPNLTKSIAPKLLINVGAGRDIPSGASVTGRKGEKIINGGLSNTTGIIGIGNSFKSTEMHDLTLTAASRMKVSCPVLLQSYDTEMNMLMERLSKLVEQYPNLDENTIFDTETGDWIVVDKGNYLADEWWEIVKEYLNAKSKDTKNYVETPFTDPRTKGILKIPPPSWIQIDSASELEATVTVNMTEDNQLGDSGGNTLFMKQGLVKHRLLMELPRMAAMSNSFFLITAHLGTELSMGGKYDQPVKKLQHLRKGDKIKGISDKFLFLMSSLWYVTHSKPYIAADKGPEYPKKIGGVKDTDGTELHQITTKQLRSKSGPSGYALPILVSQSSGVQRTLSDFDFIKTNKRFGLAGNVQNYQIVLRPDVNLTRTTIRTKIAEDRLLDRAITICSELLQMSIYWPYLVEDGIWCTPEVLYSDLKDMGYDWDVLLNTRGWWTPDQYNPKCGNFLSTEDLLRMRKGLYTPYWMGDDKLPKKNMVSPDNWHERQFDDK